MHQGITYTPFFSYKIKSSLTALRPLHDYLSFKWFIHALCNTNNVIKEHLWL